MKKNVYDKRIQSSSSDQKRLIHSLHRTRVYKTCQMAAQRKNVASMVEKNNLVFKIG